MIDKEAKYKGEELTPEEEKALKVLNKIFNTKGIKFESVDDYIARFKKEDE